MTTSLHSPVVIDTTTHPPTHTHALAHTHTHTPIHYLRFTGFLNGRDHITMEEQVGHDWTFIDDSSDETDDDSGDDRGSPQSSHLSSSVDSSHPSFDSSPVRHRPPHSPPRSHRPPHSPPRSHHPPNTPPRSHAGPTLGYNSPYRPKPTDRRMPYSSPSKSRTYYNTTY